MSSAIIQLRDVTKIYRVGKVDVLALKNVDLDVPQGEFVVVLGPSGSGKTTLLNLIGGIDKPTSGSIVVNGIEVDKLSDEELTEFRRKNIGFVFQFFNLIPTLTAKENVMLTAELVGYDKEKAEKKALELLSLVGLRDFADRFPSELSGGQQQRIAIARALAKDPPVLLCDEPTGELDVESGKMVLSLLKKLNVEQGKTIVLVTHNTVIANIATMVVRLRNGQIAEVRKVEHPMSVDEIAW